MTPRDNQHIGSLQTIGVTIVGTALLMLMPLVNGAPFFYFDTTTYIEQLAKAVQVLLTGHVQTADAASVLGQGHPAFGTPNGDNVVKGGRSIFYGVPAYLGWITTIWLPVALQAATLSWLVVKLFQLTCPAIWMRATVIVLTLVSFLSSAAFFAGLIMPDVWVGLMVLALALVWVFGKDLTGQSQFLLFAIISFGALTHNSHLALLAVMIVMYGVLRIIPALRPQLIRGSVGLPVLALAVGIIGNLAFTTAVRVMYDAKVIQMPHITAHLVDLGPGARFAQESCPESGFAICDYADRLPLGWIAFLFDREKDTGVFATAPQPVQEALVNEQLKFSLATFWAEPIPVFSGLIGDGLEQLWTLSIEDVPISPSNNTYISKSFPTDLAKMVGQSRIYSNPDIVVRLSRIIQISTIFSTFIILLWMVQRVKAGAPEDRPMQDLYGIAVVLICGIVLNALICGTLASPYGRFQARIVWLLPLLAALLWAERSRNWRVMTGNFLGSK